MKYKTFKGKFEDLKDEMDQYFKEDPCSLGNLSEYQVMYADGKYLNDYFSIDRNMYAEVIFDENTNYKTWWNNHLNSWYPENDTLAYVEIDTSDNGKEIKSEIKAIDKEINALAVKRHELKVQEKLPKNLDLR